MSRYEEVVPPEHVREFMLEAVKFFDEAEKRERNADERTKAVAQAHKDGWQAVARAISEGLGAIARAVENRR
jgi:DNA-binding IclR family transcriptional regulator